MGTESQNSALSDEQIQLLLKLERIFLPRTRKHRDDWYQSATTPEPKKSSARFVHYGSADAALKIITNKRLWMRSTTCMSDYREVEHGYDILREFFSNGSNQKAFSSALEACAPGLWAEAIKSFDQFSPQIRLITYITCVSEHDDREDLHGRLSMWRAFGSGAARVALIFKVPWHSPGARSLNLSFNPVTYSPKSEVHSNFHDVISNIKANCDFLRTVDRNLLIWVIFEMFVSTMTCLKHEGFREEREWRAIYTPSFRSSNLMQFSTEVIGGVPQRVYKIPIDDKHDPSLADLDISKIFDRLIIGPSPYPLVMFDAFTLALRNAGVAEPEPKIHMSDIPIRG